jgi:hypothetical protein
VVSAQVLGEVFAVVTREIGVPMTPDDARSAVVAIGALAHGDCLIVATVLLRCPSREPVRRGRCGTPRIGRVGSEAAPGPRTPEDPLSCT